MPAYNFRAEFAEAVESGRKTHTIRRPRKRPTRPGDRLKLYTGQRTRECRLLREVTCTRVTPVWIHCCVIYLDDRRLGYPEADELAVADGFTDFTEMNAFFERLYGPSVDLELIEWEVVTR